MSSNKSFDMNNIVTLLDPPASQVGANSSWVQPFAGNDKGERAVFMVVSGAISTNDIVLALWEATSSGGAGAQAISGATATILNNTSGEIITVEIGPGAMSHTINDDGNSTYTWVQARVTSAGAQLWTLIYIRHELRRAGEFTQDATYTSQVRVYD